MLQVLMLAWLAAGQLSPAVQPQQSFWGLVINDVEKGEIIAVLDGDKTWLPVAALEEGGLRRLRGERRSFFNTEHVLLESLAPDVTYRRDMTEVILRIIAAPQYFDTNVVVLQRERPEGISYASTASLFSNYSVTWDETAGTSGYGATGVSVFGNTSIGSAYSVDEKGRFSRGLSTMTVDRRASRFRMELGDTVARATPLGSAPILAGLSLGRDYSLDPYYYRYPTPFIRGTATAPSEVDIFVNGVRVRRLDVGPGPYRFDRLPVNAGLGNVQISVRDPFGGQQRYDVNLYQATGVLRRGENDFQFAAGKYRDDRDGGQPVYGEWQGTAYHRVGISDWLTLGYSGEGSETVIAGGPTVSMRLSRLGEIELNGWVSQNADRQQGFAGYGVYTFVSSVVNISATGQYYDDRFANLLAAPGDFTTPEYYQVSMGVPIWNLGSLSYLWEQRRSPAGGFGYTLPSGLFDPEIVRSRANTLRANLRLPLGLQLTASATLTNVRGDDIWTGFTGLNLVLGRSGTTANATYSHLQERPYKSLDINRGLPVGPGIGFRLTGSDLENGSAGGEFEANTRFNRVRLTYDAAEGGDRQNASATVSGGISATRGGLYFTRPLDASAAVVEVAGLKGVRILVDNTEIGRTNRNGKVLVSQLLPYLANRISFAEEDIPFDYRVPASSRLVAPPYRGAAFIKFPTQRIHGRMGTVILIVAGQRVVPSYGTITVMLDGVAVESPLNEAGEFFLDLPNGRHTATVAFKDTTCEFSFEATTATTLVQRLGTLTCAP